MAKPPHALTAATPTVATEPYPPGMAEAELAFVDRFNPSAASLRLWREHYCKWDRNKRQSSGT
jgi:hypothetical protein